jgi:proline iminopeptidase
MASEVNPSFGYAHTEAFDSRVLPVGTIHKLHYEQYGKKDGKPGKTVHL